MSSKSAKDGSTIGWHGKPQYDESYAEQDRVRRRAEIRRKLKAEFNRLHYNPYKASSHVEILDPAVQRFMAMRATMYEYWKPSWKGFFFYMGITFVPIFAFGHHINSARAAFDQKCRTGEIPYHMRNNKSV